jgi:uncharacterized protein (TIGR01777 family)
MKILLTGATGLLGKELGKHLVEQGHEVVAVTRNRKKAALELPYPADIVEWISVYDEFPIHELPAVEAVIHLMGEGIADRRWSAATKKALHDSRVLSTEKLSRALSKQKNLKIWLQGSAIGFYGSSPELMTESSKNGTDYLAELTSKWETALALPADHNIRTVILRTGIVFSHQGGAFPKMFAPFKNHVGSILGDGQQWMSLIHIQDWVRFVLQALKDQRIQGAYNLVAPKPIQNSEFTKIFADILNVNAILSAPKFALKALMGEMSTAILSSQKVGSEKLKQCSFQFLYPDTASILKECVSWFKSPFVEKQWCSMMATEQWVPKSLEDVFLFFSDAKNLEVLTPDFLGFKILRKSTAEMGQGTEIEYQIKLHGIPMRWLTNIVVWEKNVRFVDNQVKGPYALWYHEHRFKRLGSGTLIQDHIRYRLPMGQLGALFGGAYVKNDVSKIFRYRQEKIKTIF